MLIEIPKIKISQCQASFAD